MHEAVTVPERLQARGAPRAGLFAILMAVLGSACPQHASNESAPTPAVCTELGQRCEVSPGKLGSCVVIDNCRQGNCFVCQSQH